MGLDARGDFLPIPLEVLDKTTQVRQAMAADPRGGQSSRERQRGPRAWRHRGLGLRPRRTIRVVLWTNEENGLRGANAYRDAHMDEIDNHILAMESDAGVFKPSGFGFTGPQDAFAIIQEIGTLLERIESGTL